MHFGAVMLLLAMIAGCHEVPITGRKAFVAMPEGQMAYFAEKSFAEIKRKGPISTDKKVTQRITEIGQRITKVSGSELDWEFIVLDEPGTANAFCLPGGKVAIYTGILPVAKTDAGLAAIIGHEVGHVIARHGAERTTQRLSANIGLLIVSLFIDAGGMSRIIMETVGMGVNVGMLLPFSRLHETEADVIGLHYMARAGYDPREAVGVWDRMARKSSGRGPAFLSTHPNSAERAKDLAAKLTDVIPMYEKSEKRPARNLDVN